MSISEIILSISMILNGIFFFPPSEYMYLVLFITTNGNYTIYFVVLPATNSIGHLILYSIFRRWPVWNTAKAFISLLPGRLGTLVSAIVEIIVFHSERYLSKYDKQLWIVAYGRCMPVVHTGISIVAAQHGMPAGRFLLFTILGNTAFSHFWFFFLSLLGRDKSTWELIIWTTIIILAMYSIHIFISHIINKKLNTR